MRRPAIACRGRLPGPGRNNRRNRGCRPRSRLDEQRTDARRGATPARFPFPSLASALYYSPSSSSTADNRQHRLRLCRYVGRLAACGGLSSASCAGKRPPQVSYLPHEASVTAWSSPRPQPLSGERSIVGDQHGPGLGRERRSSYRGSHWLAFAFECGPGLPVALRRFRIPGQNRHPSRNSSTTVRKRRRRAAALHHGATRPRSRRKMASCATGTCICGGGQRNVALMT